MGSEVQGQLGQSMPREVLQQCLIRDSNELVERSNAARTSGAEEMELRCECGDPSCRASLAVTRAEYMAVRDYGSRFLVNVNHENPENAWVLSENARFAVIDVVGGDARYQVLAKNPRHKWVEA
jgi:hypothetical protein